LLLSLLRGIAARPWLVVAALWRVASSALLGDLLWVTTAVRPGRSLTLGLRLV
jgi:hypothetical protein